MKKANADIALVRKKIYRYCAYQERCHQEVKDKLYQLGLRTEEVNHLLDELIAEGFVNEERFARAFAGGKFRMKKWGRLKIIRELEMRNITPRCVALALQEINTTEYRQTLRLLLHKKLHELRHTTADPFVLRSKLSRYLMQKGYEPELLWEEIRSIWPD
ncbi:MAG: recombinase RecX [Cyclobacteriaceae bacterium]|nr:MAG: recombinase RecX [Cyclobacteriaceae bacterium]